MTNTQTIKTTLTPAATLLKTEEATLEVQLLLQHVLNVNRAWLIAHENDFLQANIHAAFEILLKRRLNSEPIAYILGYREFYGLKLKVTPYTLIPRADTETLVEAALARVPTQNPNRPSLLAKRSNLETKNSDEIAPSPSSSQRQTSVLDLGTGTGAIALTIAKHRPQALVTAVDVSEKALSVAQENAETLGIDNIHFIHSDWFGVLNAQRFDVIVSNPPYIETNDTHLKQGDLRFEPISALASGMDGLDDIREIIDSAALHLNSNGWLLLEHGYNQAETVAKLLMCAGFAEVSHALDLAGIQRVTLGRLI